MKKKLVVGNRIGSQNQNKTQKEELKPTLVKSEIRNQIQTSESDTCKVLESPSDYGEKAAMDIITRFHFTEQNDVLLAMTEYVKANRRNQINTKEEEIVTLSDVRQRLISSLEIFN